MKIQHIISAIISKEIEIICQRMASFAGTFAPIALAALAPGFTTACGPEPEGRDSGQADSFNERRSGALEVSAEEPVEEGNASSEVDPFRVWVAGDAHIHTDLNRSNYRSLEESVLDTKTGGRLPVSSKLEPLSNHRSNDGNKTDKITQMIIAGYE